MYRVAAPALYRAIIVVYIKQIAERRDAQQVTRRDDYKSPRLKVFGPVGALTQGGTIGMREGTGPQAMKV